MRFIAHPAVLGLGFLVALTAVRAQQQPQTPPQQMPTQQMPTQQMPTQQMPSQQQVPTQGAPPQAAPKGAQDGGFPASLPPPDATLTGPPLPPTGSGAAAPALPFPVTADMSTSTYTLVIPPNAGNGTCSPMNVTHLSYTVPSLSANSSIQAVLACNLAAYNALLPANISDPSVSSLPPPLPELSCFPEAGSPTISNCTRTFPGNRRLRAQPMCILVKNGGDEPVEVTVVVAWGGIGAGAVGANASANATNATAGAQGVARKGAVTVALASVLVGAVAMAV